MKKEKKCICGHYKTSHYDDDECMLTDCKCKKYIEDSHTRLVSKDKVSMECSTQKPNTSTSGNMQISKVPSEIPTLPTRDDMTRQTMCLATNSVRKDSSSSGEISTHLEKETSVKVAGVPNLGEGFKPKITEKCHCGNEMFLCKICQHRKCINLMSSTRNICITCQLPKNKKMLKQSLGLKEEK